MHQFLIFVWNKTLHVSDSSSVHHQEFFTVHTAVVYVIQLASRIRTELQFRPDPARKLSAKPVWHIPLLCVQWKTPDDGQKNCPKHVDFYSKDKFKKLVHLFGFIIRLYHDARSPERYWHHLVFPQAIGIFVCFPWKRKAKRQIYGQTFRLTVQLYNDNSLYEWWLVSQMNEVNVTSHDRQNELFF